MQIIFISKNAAIILSIFLWLIFQVSAAIISRQIPAKYIRQDSFLFRERKWEKGGDFYLKYFKVKKWKAYLPDGGAIIKNGYRKKTMTDFSKENLDLYLLESRRAELTHSLAILPFWIFGLFGPFRTIIYMLIYALAVNLPCIIVQRYNRPRILRILKGKEIKEGVKGTGTLSLEFHL